jgi:hypothetical protein
MTSIGAILLLALAPARASEPAAASVEPITAVSAILKNRDQANGRRFCVVGVPTVTYNRVGRVTGKLLFRGQLDDGTGKLEFFAFGKFPAVSTGERVEICGKFHKHYLHRNGVGVSNEIIAEAILKGAGIAAGKVELGPNGVRARKK